MGLLDDVITDLKKIEGETENPLRVIGFSKEFLELGLNEDELHRFCLRLARDLFSIFHEDVKTKTPRTADLQAKYSAAFSDLKDRKRFNMFLREFSIERSEEKSEETFMRRILNEQTAILEHTRQSEDMLQRENNSLKERQQGLVNNFSAYLRALASDVSFPKNGTWSPMAPLTASGQIAILSVRFPNRKDKNKTIPFGLEERVREATSVLRNLSFFSSEGHKAFVDIVPFRNGRIATQKVRDVLGCVDGRWSKAFVARHPVENVVTVEFQEIEMLASLQPFLFFPGILVQSFSDRQISIREKKAEKAAAELREKILPRSQRKATANKGVQFSPHYMFLGFMADE